MKVKLCGFLFIFFLICCATFVITILSNPHTHKKTDASNATPAADPPASNTDEGKVKEIFALFM